MNVAVFPPNLKKCAVRHHRVGEEREEPRQGCSPELHKLGPQGTVTCLRSWGWDVVSRRLDCESGEGVAEEGDVGEPYRFGAVVSVPRQI